MKTRLRQLLDQPGIVVAPGVFDCVSARLTQEAGFAAGYVSGGGASASVVGQPDLGLMTLTEMAVHAQHVCAAVSIPLIADADSGYGSALNVVRTVREYERSGVAGMHLEDQVHPKRCGHLPDKLLVPVGEFEAKIRAALEARRDPDFVIVARTDARGPLGLDAAIERGNRYAAAGADMVFVEAPQSVDEIERIAKEIDAPLLINMIANSITPAVGLDDLEQLGYKIAIFPMVNLSAAVLGMKAALRDLKASGTSDGEYSVSPRELFSLVGLDAWETLKERYGGGE